MPGTGGYGRVRRGEREQGGGGPVNGRARRLAAAPRCAAPGGFRGVPDRGGARELPAVGRSPRGRAASGQPPEVPLAVVLELLVAASTAGATVPRALGAVGEAIGGARGATLAGVATTLLWGAPWDEAWAAAPPVLAPVADALRPAWEQGAPPARALRAAAEQVRRDTQSAAHDAAARLAVRLVLPLGLCHLPAFVLVGIVPVVLALVSGTLAG